MVHPEDRLERRRLDEKKKLNRKGPVSPAKRKREALKERETFDELKKPEESLGDSDLRRFLKGAD